MAAWRRRGGGRNQHRLVRIGVQKESNSALYSSQRFSRRLQAGEEIGMGLRESEIAMTEQQISDRQELLEQELKRFLDLLIGRAIWTGSLCSDPWRQV